jgi:ferredoxin-NADP reductase
MPGALSRANWRVAVLVEEDGRGGSLYIREEVHEGDEIEVLGPRNHFPLTAADSYVFIAGGIGVTPLIPMIEELDARDATWKLIYLGRSIEAMAYAEELSGRYPDRVLLSPRDTAESFDIESAVAELPSDTHVYSCGPERLLSAIEAAMGETGLERVHVERFHPREVVADGPDQEFIVYCKRSDVELVVPDDESILMAADFAGIDIPGDCMEGTCGACETRVFEGEIDHRDSVLTPQAREAGETMMICVSRCKGGRLVIDL